MRSAATSGLAKLVIDDKATIEMPPLFTPETRVPGSSIVLPANPLTDVDEAALDATTASTHPFALHAMTAHERTWFLAAFGAVILLAALVIGSAVVSAA